MATKAIYQHHERTTTAAVEGDLQLREVGIDPQTKMLIARSENLSAFLHFIAKETINPSLDSNLSIAGTLGVTGAATLSSTASVASTLTLGAGIVMNNGQNIVIKNASSTNRYVLTIDASNNTELGGTADGGIEFFVNAGNNGGTVSSAGAWSLPSTLLVTGAITNSALSSGRIVVTSTSGLITQDNLYWDATNDRMGIGSGASSPSGALDIRSSVVGGNLQGIVFNSDNTNTASHARWQVTSGGASGGDAYFQASINGSIDWAMGIDNSDSDAWVLSEASTLGTNNRLRIASGGAVSIPGTLTVTGNLTLTTLSSGRIPVVSTSGLLTQDNLYWDATNDRLGIGSGASTPTADITLIKSTVGAGVQLTIYNSDNTNTASEGRLVIASGGSGAGDAYITLSNQVVDWSIGLDNSNSDSLVISEANVLGSNNRLRIASGGAVTLYNTLTVTTSATGEIVSFTGGSASTDDAYVEISAPDRAYLNLYASYNDYNGMIGFDGSNSTLNLVIGANTWGSNGIAIGASSVNIYENLASTQGFRLDSRSLISSPYSTNNASPSSFDVSAYTYLDYNVNTASSTYVETTNEYNGSILFVWNRNASSGVLYVRGASGESYAQIDVGYKAILVYHSTYSGWIRFSHQA